MAAYLSKLREGAESTEAWREAKKGILSDKMKYGLWDGDVLVQDTAKSRDPACSVEEIRWAIRLQSKHEITRICPLAFLT